MKNNKNLSKGPPPKWYQRPENIALLSTLGFLLALIGIFWLIQWFQSSFFSKKTDKKGRWRSRKEPVIRTLSSYFDSTAASIQREHCSHACSNLSQINKIFIEEFRSDDL